MGLPHLFNVPWHNRDASFSCEGALKCHPCTVAYTFYILQRNKSLTDRQDRQGITLHCCKDSCGHIPLHPQSDGVGETSQASALLESLCPCSMSTGSSVSVCPRHRNRGQLSLDLRPVPFNMLHNASSDVWILFALSLFWNGFSTVNTQGS